MDKLQTLYDEVIQFLGIKDWLAMFKSGDYSSLHTLDGLTSAIGPLIPVLLIIEIIRALVSGKFKGKQYRVIFFIYVFNRVIGQFISIAAVTLCIGWFEKYAIVKSTFAWYWLIYGYIIWELGHFAYHYSGHKVRLFWCLHSTHHTPESMNLFVGHAHFFLEGPYAGFIRTTVCILFGVNPPLLFFIMFIDGTWGGLIHLGDNVLKDGRLGFLNKIILTPSHHRVHHAKNPLYMDTNFCNLLNIWDRVFRTYQPERNDMEIEYGITRKMNPNSFLDVYFGEIVALAKDVKSAPGIKAKILYIFMPPGWSHTGEHKTASVVRREFLENNVNKKSVL